MLWKGGTTVFQIDALSRTPVYLQLIGQMERLILTGVLPPGAQVPSVRNLSIDLSVNPNTIQKAYSELDARGLLCAVPGRGCFVTEQALENLRESARRRLTELDALLRQLRLSGLGREEILHCVDTVYPPAEEEKKPAEPAGDGEEGVSHDPGTDIDQTV